jgi:hypothetical protein
MIKNQPNSSDSTSDSAKSIILNLEIIKKRYLLTLKQYDQEQKNYFQYLTKFPPGNLIKNGNFLVPNLTTNSYSYFTGSTQIPDWIFNNGAIINQSTAWGYPLPYPNGNQAVSIQKNSSISQKINLSPGTYQLSFVCCGRNCCDRSTKSNPIQIRLNEKIIYSLNPINDKWTSYSTSFIFESTINSLSTITFAGTWTSSDRSSAIQNIQITNIGFKTVPNSSFLSDKSIIIQQVDNLQTCMASCSSNSKECSGATFNQENNMCSLGSGKGSIVSSPNSNNTAIVSDNLYYLNSLQKLNDQLIFLNNQMKNLIAQGAPIYDDSIKENALSSKTLSNYYQKLELERQKINNMIKEYESLSQEQQTTHFNSNNYYFIFYLLSLFCLFLIFLILFYYYKPGYFSFNSSNSSTSSSSTTLLPNIM